MSRNLIREVAEAKFGIIPPGVFLKRARYGRVEILAYHWWVPGCRCR